MELIVIGGGAAGVFGAISAKEANPHREVVLLEKSAVLLAKVKVSGGGRCNVTHACFDPKLLVKNYPRGEKELLGPFHKFGPKETIEWFASRGVKLKTEKDGRMFPVTDSSETIISCLLNTAKKLGVEIRTRQKIENVEEFKGKKLLLATGSSPDGYRWAKAFGHTIQSPVPSLFTFNVPTSPLKELSGVVVANVEVSVGPFSQTGPLLITHFGFSGPVIIKLSAWAARYLHEKNYNTDFTIYWPEELPKSLLKIKDLPTVYRIEGKTTNKEEFVTCGGVTLKEVDFRTMESKIHPGLHFAGEILDIDGVTGGFNFQNAWTTGKLAGNYV